MHENLKALVVVILIPTIIWGMLMYWHFLYTQGIIPGLRGYHDPNIVFPFWVVHTVMLICYIGTMICLYVFVKVKYYQKYSWKIQ